MVYKMINKGGGALYATNNIQKKVFELYGYTVAETYKVISL